MKFLDILKEEEQENKLVSLIRSIESEIDKVDDSLSYEDFAFVVAAILKNGYGTSVTAMFMKELANQLKK